MENENNLPKRKKIRLSQFDYSSNGAYFITLCTKDRRKLLSKIHVGTTIGRPPDVVLTKYGQIVENVVLNIGSVYPSVRVSNYIIMPNHVHILLMICREDGQKNEQVPTIARIVQQMKGVVSKKVGFSIWQTRFYDHVVRTEQDYREINDYIINNPARWVEDEYY